MAEIIRTSVTGSNQVPVTITTLGASDTLVFDESKRPVLYLNNVTAGALTPLIVGDESTSFPAHGIGDIDTSAGKLLTLIGIGATVAFPLVAIKGYLSGTITITGGDGIEASILEF